MDIDAGLRLGAVVCRALDPVAVPRGFAPGQVGVAGGVGITFCGAYREVRARLGVLDAAAHGRPVDARLEPLEPDPDEADAERDLWCSDVSVDVALDAAGRPYLDTVRLDGVGLPALLRGVGLDDFAARAVGLDGPVDPANAEGFSLVSVWTGGARPTAAELAEARARALAESARTGPLCEAPLDEALAEAALLLDALFAEAERRRA